jgi:hypothetical protein
MYDVINFVRNAVDFRNRCRVEKEGLELVFSLVDWEYRTEFILRQCRRGEAFSEICFNCLVSMCHSTSIVLCFSGVDSGVV